MCIFAVVKRLIYILTIFFILTVTTATAETPIDTLYRDIEQVEITASIKGSDMRSAPISTTSLSMLKLEERGISSVKELTAIAPNFYQPDYGSSITSSIYVRGFGSRIDQPVLGVTIDDIPLMNKNIYDFDFYDIRKLELLRGPQGTLYGRNTSGGVMNITTLSPLSWQGLRAMAEYSTMTSYRASAAYYAKPRDNYGISVAAHFNHEGGYFRNTYTDQMCDSGNNASARLRMQWLLRDNWSLDNSLTWGYTKEGGYAYHHLNPTTNTTEAVAYNDPAGYERIAITEGFVAKYQGEKILLSSATSYQYLNDVMTLDQDFTPKSMFTMQQKQREHTITEEVVVRNADRTQRWQWLTGAFAFAKWLDMSSPVTFKRDGIDELILGNINNGIHTVFPNNNMLIGGDNFVINSDFSIPTYGAALYHQSSYRLGNWQLTAGIRFDLEQAHDLLPPAVGNIERSVGDVAIIVPAVVRCDVLLEGVDDIKDDGGNTDIGYGGLYLGVFLVGDGKVVIYLRFVLVGVGYHALELFPTIDTRDIQAYDESVIFFAVEMIESWKMIFCPSSSGRFPVFPKDSV